MIISRRRFIGTAAATLAFSSTVRVGTAFAQEKPQYGGHLRVGYALEPTSLDPMVGRSGGDIYYLRAMFDVLVEKDENCLPMIPSGKPHNEIILPDTANIGSIIDEKGKMLV